MKTKIPLAFLTLLTVLLAACGPTPGTQGQPSSGGDTAKLEADIAALSTKVDANQTALLARSDTTIEKLDGIVTLISNNQTANSEAFTAVGAKISAGNTAINAKLDQILAKLNGTPTPPSNVTVTNHVEWDYEHRDDGLGPISGFNIQRSEDGGTVWHDYVQVPGADTRKYDDKPITPGNYCYRVIAFRVRDGGSTIDYSEAPSNVACIVVAAPPPVL